MRDSFIFYKSFYDSIKELDPKDQVQIYNAIFKYQFEEEEIELNGVCKSIFILIIPQLEANNKRYENGKKGGAPKGNQNAKKTTKKQPKNNQKQPNVNVNVNVNDNVNDNDIIITNNIYDFVEQNFGRTLNAIEYEEISKWEDNELTRYAIKEAILKGKYAIKYISAVLDNYKKNNIISINQAQQEEQNYKHTKDNKKMTAQEKRFEMYKRLEQEYDN